MRVGSGLFAAGVAALVAMLTAIDYPSQRMIGEEHPRPAAVATQVLFDQEAQAPIEKLGGDWLVLARPGRPLRFGVDAHTQVVRFGQPSELGKLHAGEVAKVTYDRIARTPRAKRIEVAAVRS